MSLDYLENGATLDHVDDLNDVLMAEARAERRVHRLIEQRGRSQ
jgi:hypothetical protein